MDYDLIVVKTLERVYKNYYYIIRGEEKIHTASQVNLTEPFKEMRNEKINILG